MYIIKESTYDLDSKFKYFNKEFFDDLLPITKVSFEKLSSQAAGAFFLKSKKIVISTDLIGKPEVYIDHILIHEMIHYYNKVFNLDSGKQAHGLAFKAKTDEINKKTNNKYKLTLTHVSMSLEYDERDEKVLYVLVPHIGTTVSAASMSATIQFFTEENFNSSYTDSLVKSYQNFADAKRFSIIKTTMNNNYIDEAV
jgi:predicted SprT family Zn-dependent metalloprotease